MRKICNKGHRIRASDKQLVYHFSIGTLLFVFVAVLLLLNTKQLMLFGSDVKKQFFQKRIKGRGYCDVGTSVISEFYTPLVPKGHDFLQTIGSLAQARQDGTATCEAKGDGTD